MKFRVYVSFLLASLACTASFAQEAAELRPVDRKMHGPHAASGDDDGELTLIPIVLVPSIEVGFGAAGGVSPVVQGTGSHNLLGGSSWDLALKWSLTLRGRTPAGGADQVADRLRLDATPISARAGLQGSWYLSEGRKNPLAIKVRIGGLVGYLNPDLVGTSSGSPGLVSPETITGGVEGSIGLWLYHLYVGYQGRFSGLAVLKKDPDAVSTRLVSQAAGHFSHVIRAVVAIDYGKSESKVGEETATDTKSLFLEASFSPATNENSTPVLSVSVQGVFSPF